MSLPKIQHLFDLQARISELEKKVETNYNRICKMDVDVLSNKDRLEVLEKLTPTALVLPADQ